MNTPICDFVKKYSENSPLRLHMPGHKGVSLLGYEPYDITEVEGADVLYNPKGIIAESMENARKIFRSGKTVYSTEGSTLSIKAMLYLATLWAKHKGQKPLVLAARNVHKSFISAAALLDLDVKWLYPDGNFSLISCHITPESLKKSIENMEDKPTAVYITSPDYLGNTLDIEGISKVCKEQDILLLVDNAHGAYLTFLGNHPLTQGADICCDSAHKTLPVLTGGGYLHISENAPDFLKDKAYNAMDIFASTSPSYLILQSLDNANKLIDEGYKEKVIAYCKETENLKDYLIKKGHTLVGNEPLKITISTKPFGYKGEDFAKILMEKNLVPEFFDKDFVVLMLSPYLQIGKIKKVLSEIPKCVELSQTVFPQLKLKQGVSIREAMLCDYEELPVENCIGRIAGSPVVSCPPAVPVVVCSEIIDENAVEIFKYYGTKKCRVIKEIL